MTNDRTDMTRDNHESEWVIRINLGEDVANQATADKWMDLISAAVLTHDPGFSGLVSMSREILTSFEVEEAYSRQLALTEDRLLEARKEIKEMRRANR